MNNFVKRTLSGALLVTLIVGSILLGGIAFAAFFGLICAGAVQEFQKLTNTQEQISVNIWTASIGALLLFGCSFLYISGNAQFSVFSAYGIFIVLVFVAELYRQKSNPLHNWAYFILGQVMVALPFALLPSILYIDGYQPIILLSVFVTIWVNDTGAYLFGVQLGKHRLFERISPKKSWEGFIGGALTALLSGYIFSLFVPSLTLLQWLVFSEIIVVFSTFGDLLESMLKRTVHVKDSGDVIPGHGGILDRFDSLLLAAPVIFIYLTLILK
jgi:phosphatidate cytidylyltransferase